MDANLTVMIVTNKLKQSNSSYFFNDEMLGWAAYENSKKRFNYKYGENADESALVKQT